MHLGALRFDSRPPAVASVSASASGSVSVSVCRLCLCVLTQQLKAFKIKHGALEACSGPAQNQPNQQQQRQQRMHKFCLTAPASGPALVCDCVTASVYVAVWQSGSVAVWVRPCVSACEWATNYHVFSSGMAYGIDTNCCCCKAINCIRKGQLLGHQSPPG